jgi:hypothetical protein
MNIGPPVERGQKRDAQIVVTASFSASLRHFLQRRSYVIDVIEPALD